MRPSPAWFFSRSGTMTPRIFHSRVGSIQNEDGFLAMMVATWARVWWPRSMISDSWSAGVAMPFLAAEDFHDVAGRGGGQARDHIRLGDLMRTLVFPEMGRQISPRHGFRSSCRTG